MIDVVVFTETLSRIGGGEGREYRTADGLRSWAYLRVQGI